MNRKLGLIVGIVSAVLGLGLAVGVWMFFGNDQGRGLTLPSGLARVTAMPVPDAAKTTWVEVEGVVEQSSQSEILPEVGGRVTEVMARPGQMLRKGQPLFKLDDTASRQQYAKLQTELALLHTQLQQASVGDAPTDWAPMSEDDLDELVPTADRPPDTAETEITVEDTDAAQGKNAADHAAKYDNSPLGRVKRRSDQVSAKMKALQERIEAHVVRMPRSGKLTQFTVAPNTVITPLESVGTVLTSEHPIVTAKMPIELLRNIKPNQKVRVRAQDDMGRWSRFEGEVVAKEMPEGWEEALRRTEAATQGPARLMVPGDDSAKPQAKPGANAMPSVANAGGADPETTGEAADDEVDHLEGSVTVEVIEGSVRRLKTDQFVSLDFEVPGLGYVWIPKEAIQVRQGRQVVYVVNREHGRTCVMERPVMTGDESKAQMEIKSGLNPGEQIVIEGVTSLQHQQEVAVVQTREADTGPERRL